MAMQAAQTGAIVAAEDANVELVDRVHPPTWVNPEPAQKYDLVVLGGGTAGLVSAMGAGVRGRAREGRVDR